MSTSNREPLRQVELTLDGPHEALRAVCGELDQHLAQVSRALAVRVSRRGSELRIGGDDGSVDLAAHVLEGGTAQQWHHGLERYEELSYID